MQTIHVFRHDKQAGALQDWAVSSSRQPSSDQWGREELALFAEAMCRCAAADLDAPVVGRSPWTYALHADGRVSVVSRHGEYKAETAQPLALPADVARAYPTGVCRMTPQRLAENRARFEAEPVQPAE